LKYFLIKNLHSRLFKVYFDNKIASINVMDVDIDDIKSTKVHPASDFVAIYSTFVAT
jgi:hypothetical protein